MATPPIVTQYAGPTPYKLNNVVTGNDVFTSAFYPNQISNLAIWLDGSDVLGDGSSYVGTVDLWANKASNSITVTKNFNPSNEPPESIGNSVSFANPNDETTVNGLDTTYVSDYNNETVFILLTNTESANNYNLLFPADSSSGSRQLYLSNSSPFKILTSATYIQNTLLSEGNISPGSPTLISTWANGSILKHYVNGQFINQAAIIYNPTLIYTRIGTDNYAGLNGFNGTISEIIIYSNALSDSERQKVESYLYWKWNTFSLNPSNPYTTQAYSNYLYPNINSNLIPPIPRNLFSGLPTLDSNNYPLIKNFIQLPNRLKNSMF